MKSFSKGIEVYVDDLKIKNGIIYSTYPDSIVFKAPGANKNLLFEGKIRSVVGNRVRETIFFKGKKVYTSNKKLFFEPGRRIVIDIDRVLKPENGDTSELVLLQTKVFFMDTVNFDPTIKEPFGFSVYKYKVNPGKGIAAEDALLLSIYFKEPEAGNIKAEVFYLMGRRAICSRRIMLNLAGVNRLFNDNLCSTIRKGDWITVNFTYRNKERMVSIPIY